LGLDGMIERAELMKGKLTLSSKPGSGTKVIIEVPNG
jgi:signal transduction histidine kinase